jgi:hypothetical protein
MMLVIRSCQVATRLIMQSSRQSCAHPHCMHLSRRVAPTHPHSHGFALQVPGLMAPPPLPAGNQPLPSAASGPGAAAPAAAGPGKAGRQRVRIVSANNSTQPTQVPAAAAAGVPGHMLSGAGQPVSPGAIPSGAGCLPQGQGSPGPHMGPPSPASPHCHLPNSYSGSWPGQPGAGSGSPGSGWVQGAGLPPPAWVQQGQHLPVNSSWGVQPPPQQQQQQQQGPWGGAAAAAGGGPGAGALSGAGSLAAEGSVGWGVGGMDREELQRQARLAKQQQYKVRALLGRVGKAAQLPVHVHVPCKTADSWVYTACRGVISRWSFICTGYNSPCCMTHPTAAAGVVTGGVGAADCSAQGRPPGCHRSCTPAGACGRCRRRCRAAALGPCCTCYACWGRRGAAEGLGWVSCG